MACNYEIDYHKWQLKVKIAEIGVKLFLDQWTMQSSGILRSEN